MTQLNAAARLLVATVLALGFVITGAGVGGHGPATVLAATPDLTLVSDATYDVRPDRGRVAISVDITATNRLHNTLTKRFYFRTAFLAVLPQASAFKLTSAHGKPHVSVARRTNRYTLLKLDFGTRLGAGASRRLTLTFNLVDRGGAPDRQIRISPSLVQFYAWAFATPSTPGSSVSVTFPAGYTVTVGRGPLDGPSVDAGGNQLWSSGALHEPLSFVADLTADRPADYVETPHTVDVGGSPAALLVRSWPDDPAWGTRVGELVSEALPAMSEEIGVGWPMTEPLVVQEALPKSTGGYAGMFDPATHRIEVAYSATDGVILHEAAHAWFNGALVADRWAAEAFASYYAEVAGAALGVEVASPELDALDDAQRTAAIPLNAWGPVGSNTPEVESYCYAASLALARAVAHRAGDQDLRQVWRSAADGVGAYQPQDGPPELATSQPDWRALLDLLEEVTGRSYVDLWQRWVLRPEDMPALAARDAARAAYDRGVEEAGDWRLPPSIRAAMRAWQFEDAERQLEAAAGVIRQRAALEREAAATDATLSVPLELPTTLRTEFETGDLVAAASEAAAELTTIGAIEAASAARPAEVPTLDAIGLLGTDPEASLQRAARAFADGDLDAANAAATEARTAWSSAAAVGRGRVISTLGLLIAFVLLMGLAAGLRRRGDGLHSRP